MARLPALITALAEVDDRDRKTIEHIGRVLREAGLITRTKRGVGAAFMGVTDAANLLIAANGTDAPGQAAVAVQRFRPLQAMHQANDADTTIFGRIARQRTFGEALEVAILGAPEFLGLSIAARDDAFPALQGTSLGVTSFNGLDITLSRPGAAATIEVWSSKGSQRVTSVSWSYVADAQLLADGFYGWPNADRRITVTFGITTLLAVLGEIFEPESED